MAIFLVIILLKHNAHGWLFTLQLIKLRQTGIGQGICISLMEANMQINRRSGTSSSDCNIRWTSSEEHLAYLKLSEWHALCLQRRNFLRQIPLLLLLFIQHLLVQLLLGFGRHQTLKIHICTSMGLFQYPHFWSLLLTKCSSGHGELLNPWWTHL